jgi:hypothetical protein
MSLNEPLMPETPKERRRRVLEQTAVLVRHIDVSIEKAHAKLKAECSLAAAVRTLFRWPPASIVIYAPSYTPKRFTFSLRTRITGLVRVANGSPEGTPRDTPTFL